MRVTEEQAFVDALRAKAQVDEVLNVNWIAMPQDGDYRTALAELVDECVHQAGFFHSEVTKEIRRLKERETFVLNECNRELDRRRSAETELMLTKMDVDYWRRNYLEARAAAGEDW